MVNLKVNRTSCFHFIWPVICQRIKSKNPLLPVVNCPFIFWKTGSWAVAWALRANDSEAALENMVETLETFSKPTPKVLTSFLTKFRVCGVILASDTAPLFSNATE